MLVRLQDGIVRISAFLHKSLLVPVEAAVRWQILSARAAAGSLVAFDLTLTV
jgi:hypothetical protein